MGMFGWSYPPGCDGVPDDDFDYEEEDLWEGTPSVQEFCDHIGCGNLWQCIRAIDKHSAYTVSISVEHPKDQAEFLGPENRDQIEKLGNRRRITCMRITGIAWDGTDWEFCGHAKTLKELDELGEQFEEALEEHRAIEEQEYDQEYGLYD